MANISTESWNGPLGVEQSSSMKQVCFYVLLFSFSFLVLGSFLVVRFSVFSSLASCHENTSSGLFVAIDGQPSICISFYVGA